MKKGLYEWAGPPGEVLARLEEVHVQDKRAERRAGGYGCGCSLLFVLAIVCFVSADLMDAGVLGWVGGSLFAAGVPFLVLMLMAHSHDLDDSRVRAPLELMRILRADLPPGRAVRVRVDHRDYAAGDFQVSGRGNFFGVKHTEYRQPWLRLRARLADGASVDLRVVRKARRREFWKSSGGKSKRKFKDRVRDLIVLRLRVPGATMRNLPDRLPGDPPEGLVARRVEASGDTVRMVLETPPAKRSTKVDLNPADLAGPERLLAPLAWIYRALG